MTTDKKETGLIRVGRPLKRLRLTFEPTTPLDGPITDGPLIRVGRPLKRVRLTFEPVATEAEGHIRRHLVSPSLGRPLAQLAAMVNEAVRIADARGGLTKDDDHNVNALRRLAVVLAAVFTDTPDAALDPELFGTLHTMLLLWALGVDLDESFRHPQAQPLLSGFHSDVLELLRALSA